MMGNRVDEWMRRFGRSKVGACVRGGRRVGAVLAFLAWLNGQQDNVLLVNREDEARDRAHYVRCAELAHASVCVRDEETFAARLAEFAAAPWPEDR